MTSGSKWELPNDLKANLASIKCTASEDYRTQIHVSICLWYFSIITRQKSFSTFHSFDVNKTFITGVTFYGQIHIHHKIVFIVLVKGSI